MWNYSRIRIRGASTAGPLGQLDSGDQFAFAHTRRAGNLQRGGQRLQLGQQHPGKSGGAAATSRSSRGLGLGSSTGEQFGGFAQGDYLS